jgi:hypothetical protein
VYLTIARHGAVCRQIKYNIRYSYFLDFSTGPVHRPRWIRGYIMYYGNTVVRARNDIIYSVIISIYVIYLSVSSLCVRLGVWKATVDIRRHWDSTAALEMLLVSRFATPFIRHLAGPLSTYVKFIRVLNFQHHKIAT